MLIFSVSQEINVSGGLNEGSLPSVRSL